MVILPSSKIYDAFVWLICYQGTFSWTNLLYDHKTANYSCYCHFCQPVHFCFEASITKADRPSNFTFRCCTRALSYLASRKERLNYLLSYKCLLASWCIFVVVCCNTCALTALLHLMSVSQDHQCHDSHPPFWHHSIIFWP